MLAAVLTLTGLCLLLATALIIANKLFFVQTNEKLEILQSLLPQNNCGACGYPGCSAFAEALLKNETQPVRCSVNTTEQHQIIAEFLGIDVGKMEKQVARLACAGGNNVARQSVKYQGMKNCRAASLINGGGKSCSWGCLGYGDCADVCQFNAIGMNKHRLPIVDSDLCTACGDCVEVCPKNLFSLQAISHQLWVACNNRNAGDELLSNCQVACTACERCVFDAPSGLMTMQNNLPIIDYTNDEQSSVPIQRCPTGAIIWFDNPNQIRKGPQAKKIIRQSPLEMAKP